MNRERAKELLPIIQAYAEGKDIQWYSTALYRWEDAPAPDWHDRREYRIKPEPIVVHGWAGVYRTKVPCSIGFRFGSVYPTKEIAQANVADDSCIDIVEVNYTIEVS